MYSFALRTSNFITILALTGLVLGINGCGGGYWNPNQPTTPTGGNGTSTLSLAAGSDGSYPGADGHGTVTLSPAPAITGSTQSGVTVYTYPAGSSVTITAHPNSDTQMKWNGGPKTNATTFSVQLTANTHVGLLFVLATSSG